MHGLLKPNTRNINKQGVDDQNDHLKPKRRTRISRTRYPAEHNARHRATQCGQSNDINRRYGRCNQRYVVRINPDSAIEKILSLHFTISNA